MKLPKYIKLIEPHFIGYTLGFVIYFDTKLFDELKVSNDKWKNNTIDNELGTFFAKDRKATSWFWAIPKKYITRKSKNRKHFGTFTLTDSEMRLKCTGKYFRKLKKELVPLLDEEMQRYLKKIFDAKKSSN